MPAATGRSVLAGPTLRDSGPLVAVALLMGFSVLLRTGVFNGVGEYSDIVHLYRLYDLAQHPVPYFESCALPSADGGRPLLIVAVFALVTFALNGPVALDLSGQGV